ncbi:MAG: 2-amino-4-hydroxy-6-hydroxymethyldihydropteridine diphosphokinase [Saprospiraceae bacterium]|nr:2-amino-4-hydroxy-6-hydroxymethyldihydropteridine diphosphokinase [Saprospiraceae bacterium]
MNTIYLALGSNLGNPQLNLIAAIESISQSIGKVEKCSSVYKTAAWGNEDQDDFYNQVVLVKTLLKPIELMNCCQQIEKKLGRISKQKWAPRIIDIDILFYNQLIFNHKDLVIPHPLIQDRNFVLVPLSEISEGYIHPANNKTIFMLKNECQDKLSIVKLKPIQENK